MIKNVNLDKSKIFLILVLSFIGGVAGRSFLKMDLVDFLVVLVVIIIILTVWYKNRVALFIVVMILFFILGAWRTNLKLSEIDTAKVNKEKFFGVVEIVKEPIRKNGHWEIITSLPNKSRVLIKSYSLEKFNYGDEINLSCVLNKPKNFSDFNYQMYLAKDSIYYLCKKAKIEKTGKNKGNKIYVGILRLKNSMETVIERTISQPEAGLAKGLLFGGSSHLPEKLKDNFSRTGMTHIVAVSGYNVTIIAEYLIYIGIFMGLWRKQAFYLALIGIFVFVAMIGFPSSAVRAGVMGSLLLWAMKNGRLANANNAIIFSGGIMLLINPLSLRWDIGFQLSFLATLGIVQMSSIWENYFNDKLRSIGLTEIILMTISAQLFVLPIIAYNFKSLSVISLLANLFILPIIPLTMLFIFLTSFLGLIWFPLSLVFSWLSYISLRYEIEVINFLAKFSWASLNMDSLPWFWVGAYYICIISGIYFFKKRIKKKIIF